MNDQHLRFPIGHFQFQPSVSDAQCASWIETIGQLPRRLRDLTSSRTSDELEQTYRPGGWTVRQLIHHCADSHMNAYLRVKFALTTDAPIIMPYPEQLWAELPDASRGDIENSLRLLEGLHARWEQTLRNLSEEQWQRIFVHPEQGKRYSILEATGLYAWHSAHHTAHVQLALNLPTS